MWYDTMKLPIDQKEFDIILDLLKKHKNDHWQLWSKLWTFNFNKKSEEN
tara:strand:- start:47 stop:193 length:147 start_codon:yes stop_codon:yes gene_type:complete